MLEDFSDPIQIGIFYQIIKFFVYSLTFTFID